MQQRAICCSFHPSCQVAHNCRLCDLVRCRALWACTWICPRKLQQIALCLRRYCVGWTKRGGGAQWRRRSGLLKDASCVRIPDEQARLSAVCRCAIRMRAVLGWANPDRAAHPGANGYDVAVICREGTAAWSCERKQPAPVRFKRLGCSKCSTYAKCLDRAKRSNRSECAKYPQRSKHSECPECSERSNHAECSDRAKSSKCLRR